MCVSLTCKAKLPVSEILILILHRFRKRYVDMKLHKWMNETKSTVVALPESIGLNASVVKLCWMFLLPVLCNEWIEICQRWGDKESIFWMCRDSESASVESKLLLKEIHRLLILTIVLKHNSSYVLIRKQQCNCSNKSPDLLFSLANLFL